MDLQKARDWSDLVLKCLSIVALIAGGIWTYYRFIDEAVSSSNIKLALSMECQPLSDKSRLLLIHVKPKNIGKVSVVADKKDGFEVVVRRIASAAPFGLLDLEKLPEVQKVDLLDRYPDGYELLPGVEYDEVVALVLPGSDRSPYDAMYAIKATFNLDSDNEIDQTAVSPQECPKLTPSTGKPRG